jgi:hypothetical protein
MFSIVIPTRERHKTLAYSMRSVLQQDYPDFELIIQDNCSGDETAQVVRSYRSPKIKYNRAPYTLPMNQNWEQALALCEGRYIFFLGDDDALMPDGMSLAASILSRAPMDVLMWDKYTYWWEDALEPSVAGRMFLHMSHGFQMIDPQALLKSHYDWEVATGGMPSIYTGFTSRELVDRVKQKTGGTYFYFGAPDNSSGIANAYFARNVGKFERGLSIGGNSAASTGCAYFFRSKGERRQKEYEAETGSPLASQIHPALIPSINLEVNWADTQLRARELLFPGDTRFEVPMDRVVRVMAANINRDPDSYESTLAEVRQLAAKHGIDMATVPIPARAFGEKVRLQGLVQSSPGGPQTLAVNCVEAGVHEVASAARLASALLPTLTIQ